MYIIIRNTGRFEYYQTVGELQRRLIDLYRLGYNMDEDIKVCNHPMFPDKGDMSGRQFLEAMKGVNG